MPRQPRRPARSLTDLRAGFELRLHAEYLSAKTIQSYLEAADQLVAFLQLVTNEPLIPRQITSDHVGAYINSLYARGFR